MNSEIDGDKKKHSKIIENRESSKSKRCWLFSWKFARLCPAQAKRRPTTADSIFSGQVDEKPQKKNPNKVRCLSPKTRHTHKGAELLDCSHDGAVSQGPLLAAGPVLLVYAVLLPEIFREVLIRRHSERKRGKDGKKRRRRALRTIKDRACVLQSESKQGPFPRRCTESKGFQSLLLLPSPKQRERRAGRVCLRPSLPCKHVRAQAEGID